MLSIRYLALYASGEALELTEEGAHVFAALFDEAGASLLDLLTEDGRHVVAAAAALEDTTVKYHVTAQVM